MAKNDIPSITFTGEIKIDGDMFNIHDNQNVNVYMNGKKNIEHEDYVFVNLEFFDPNKFNTPEKQSHLRNILT